MTRLPPMQQLGDLLDKKGPEAAQQIGECGWLMASEILSLGLDFSFAPVLDMDRDHCEVIGDRAFGDHPARVVEAAKAFIAGMHNAGMAAIGKHFPGHGAVREDSHLETPRDPRSFAEVQASDLRPFCDLCAELDGVMPAHILFPEIDEQLVGFSQFWLQTVLRRELGFDGVIFSDDLSMKGSDHAGGYCAKARAALSAGCDMVLVCNNRAGAEEVLCDLEVNGAISSKRLAKMRGRPALLYEELMQSARWKRAVRELEQLGDEA